MGDWRVKYDGVCSRCGVALRAGEVAVYDRASRTIRCVSCPAAPDPEPPEVDAGVAGRSARREHERRAAKRGAAVRGRWGDRIGGVVLALTDEPQSTRAWAVGARGEEKLSEALDGFTVLHDRRVPGTRGNIDHVVVAPAGVFVVDAKRYGGGSRSATTAGSCAPTTGSTSGGATAPPSRTTWGGRSPPSSQPWRQRASTPCRPSRRSSASSTATGR